jgi:hypothetical protein
MGKGNSSAIATLLERTSRFVILQRLPYDHTAERMAYALTAEMSHLPAMLKRSLTWDQSREMAQHAKFTAITRLPVFFCDSHSPWQRGIEHQRPAARALPQGDRPLRVRPRLPGCSRLRTQRKTPANPRLTQAFQETSKPSRTTTWAQDFLNGRGQGAGDHRQ